MTESINADNDYKNDNDDTMTMMMMMIIVMVIVVMMMMMMMMIGTLFTLVMLLAIPHPNEP